MTDIKQYFIDQEERVSNTYMSASGGQQVTTDPNAYQTSPLSNCGIFCKIGRFRDQYFDFGGMFGQQVGAIVFYGLILGGGYMIYRKIKK